MSNAEPLRLFQKLVRDHDGHIRATPHQYRQLRSIRHCRTEHLGTHTTTCLDCGHHETRYNSCRNRHCPLCQRRDQAAWVEEREADLLPIPYFHVVCTFPHELHPLCRHAPAVMYDILMTCSRQALTLLCADPQHLGAQVGQIQVLHTWGSDLKFHPHVHSIVTGGGLNPDGTWQSCRISRKKKRAFLVPVRCLRLLFRRLVLEQIRQAYHAGVFASCRHDCVASAGALNALMKGLRSRDWVVYLKRPFASAAIAVRYLGRYTHRIALDPRRLSDYDGEQVTLRWRDYRHGGQWRQKRQPATVLLENFIQHIVPKRFRRIRLSGLFGPRVRRQRVQELQAYFKERTSLQQAKETPPAPLSSPTCHCPACESELYITSRIHQRRRDGTFFQVIPEKYLRILRAHVANVQNESALPMTT